MYSGTTFHSKSGGIVGVHQRIDRIARRSIKRYADTAKFPMISEILHFEGNNGPDGIKRKRPGVDEPWHFIDPDDPGDTGLLDMIDDHLHNLTIALSGRNRERASFEAAWLAHAIADGLTPAHHYPLEEKLAELRGEGLETRTSKKDKILMPGETRRHQIRNNWEYWGAKGVMTSHIGFEMGVASAVASRPFGSIALPENWQEQLVRPLRGIFLDSLHHVADMHLYDTYRKRGWTTRLARDTRGFLIPEIVHVIMLAWLQALTESERHS